MPLLKWHKKLPDCQSIEKVIMIFSLEKATFPISFVKKAVEHEFLSAFCSFVVVISLRISPNAPNDMYSTKFYLVFFLIQPDTT